MGVGKGLVGSFSVVGMCVCCAPLCICWCKCVCMCVCVCMPQNTSLSKRYLDVRVRVYMRVSPVAGDSHD